MPDNTTPADHDLSLFLAGLRMALEWQDISTAPKDGTMFLAACGDCGSRNHWIVRWEKDSFVCGSDAEGLTDVEMVGGTDILVSCLEYWMPLPALPEQNKPET